MDRTRLAALQRELAERGLVTRWDEPMRAHTTYRIGGPADLFVVAETEAQLVAAVQETHARGLVPLMLGGGANLLVADGGIRGVVIHYTADAYRFSEQEDHVQLWSEAGAALKEVSRASIARGYEGLEWAVDVPGTVGGAVIGNAGAYGGYICDSLRRVRVLEQDGAVQELDNMACGFCYRNSKFKQQPREERSIVLSATFVLARGDADEIAARAARYSQYRRERHPSDPSCGSVFKRTANYPAGFLIEQCGLKGERRGDAIISPLHANYILNLGHARAADIRTLIELAQKQVKVQFDEDLELEVEMVGEW